MALSPRADGTGLDQTPGLVYPQQAQRQSDSAGTSVLIEPRAVKELEDEPQFPLKYVYRGSKALIKHDQVTADFLVCVIELGRLHRLSGIYFEREVRLDPMRPRPVMDVMLIVRRGSETLPPNRVPWTNDPRVDGERVRRYAVENDRDSEAMSIIVAKAYAYQVAGTQAWLDAYGPFPVPLWIVPTQRRKEGSCEPGGRPGHMVNG
jgi:hypothetical protein